MPPIARTLLVSLGCLAALGLGAFSWRERAAQLRQLLVLERSAEISRRAIERLQRERDAAERTLAARRTADQAAAAVAVAAADRVRTAPSDATTIAWEENVAKLRALLTQHAQRSIPEIGLLTEEEFAFFARSALLDTEDNQRKALRDLRALAKRKLAPLLQSAAYDYAHANGGRLPADIRDLARHLDPPLPEAVFARYALTGIETMPAAGPLGPSRAQWLLYERVPVDELHDTRQMIGVRMLGQIATNPEIYVVTRALAAYSAAHAGRTPAQASDLSPYLEAPLEPTALQRHFEIWQKSPADLGIARFSNLISRLPGVAR